MSEARTAAAKGVTLDGLVTSWARPLRAANLSARTVRSYTDGAPAFIAFATERGMPTDPAGIRREHLEAYIEHVLGRWKPSTALTRYRDLQQFFKWLVDEGEVTGSPMARMRPPKLNDKPVPVIRDTDLKALLDACAGKDFDARRDTAIVRLFMNTGARLSEIAGLTLDDVDLDHGEVWVRRKGARDQVLPLGAKTVKALDRCLRARRGHRDADSPALWLGARGAMTASGIAQMVRKRCGEAGIKPINVHRFRHTWAHQMKARGGDRRDAADHRGWKSPTMLQRYAASTAAERAKEVHTDETNYYCFRRVRIAVDTTIVAPQTAEHSTGYRPPRDDHGMDAASRHGQSRRPGRALRHRQPRD